MGAEHAPETIWQAQEMYCVDRLSFDAVAQKTGIAASTLKRWADKFAWREKREEIAKAESEIRQDKVLARSKALKTFLDKPRAEMAFAVSALEKLTLEEAEAALKAEDRAALKAAQEQPALAIDTIDDAIAALKTAVERKLSALLTRPEMVDLKSVQEVQRCLTLLAEMQAARPVDDKAAATKGMSQDMHALILDAMSGV